MSASEKLRALRLQPVVYVDGDFKYRDGFSEESLRPLLNALPQIVAVVEAAEFLKPLDHDAMCAYHFDPFGTKPCNCSKGRTEAALTALEEALG